MATKQLIDGVILVRVNGAKREVRVISSEESELMSDLSFEEKAIVNKVLSDAAEAAEAAAAAGSLGGCTAQLVGSAWTCENNGCSGTCRLITTTYDSALGMAVSEVVTGTTSVDLDTLTATSGARCECPVGGATETSSREVEVSAAV